jgi:signal transduction histidine kinase/putative methionine-R-sulfoxide reductase with GAF domain
MSGEELRLLADEQAALRRVATLVAGGAASEELFAAITEEVGRLLPVDFADLSRYEHDGTITMLATWGTTHALLPTGARLKLGGKNLSTIVAETGASARLESYADASGSIGIAVREAGIRSVVGTPIIVDGRVWGMVAAGSSRAEPMPANIEERLTQFTELLATAVANAESRAGLARLADEQAALRRVATLVAEDVPPSELFEAVAREVGTLLGADFSGMIRYEDDATVSSVAAWAAAGEHPPGPDRWSTEPGDPATMISETRQPARVEDWAAVPGPIAAVIREKRGVSSSVGCPIVVEGRLWGALAVHSTQLAPLPPDTEERAAKFADLLATAIGNAEARAEVGRLAREQAALRRVATLVAQGTRPAEIFSAVADEIGGLVGAPAAVVRFELDGPAIVFVGVASSLDELPVGTRWELDDSMASAEVLRTGRSARVEAIDWSSRSGSVADAARRLGVVSTVASPVIVENRLWGAVTVSSMDGLLLVGVEQRLENFTELVATAVANAESREARGRLADEQAALRRVATLVAEGASPTAVFDAVAGEMEALLDADQLTLNRFEPGDEITVLAHRGLDVARTPVGSRVSHRGESVTATVRQTGRPARMEGYEGASGPLAELARATGLRSGVSAPIVVDGRLWGIMTACWKGEQSPAPGIEERMAQFAELLDTAIANADSRDQLTASRARLLTEGDEARRRLVRDLHDGAQQRLVHTIITLKLAQRASWEKDGTVPSLIMEALEHAEQGNEQLRELAHGILPSVLTVGGLRAGVEAMAARLDLPVRVHVPDQRLPAEIEASAYFVVAEALTNVVKHAQAGRAEVTAAVEDGMLRVAVRDDGTGGADPGGHGLVAMGDRVTALGGRLEIESPAGGGTLLAATLPL